jgi:S-(hydroxymethyl)glutathione dehydrogenase/alcohol dehydrogenase
MPKKSKAVVCRDWAKPVEVEEIVVDSPQANQVMIQMEAIGVCHSDLSASNGTMPIPPPLVLGHEACGRIVELGEGVVDCAVGDKVIPSWIPSCGHCRFCAEGRAVLCDDWAKSFFGPKDGTRPVKDASGNLLGSMSGVGVMSEYAILHKDNIIKIGPEVPSDKAALVGCGVMTGVGAVFNRARVKPGSSCAVIGAGGVGLNVIQGCAIAGAETIVAVDMVDKKLEFEVIGLGATIAQTYQAVRKGGTAVIIGVPKMTEMLQLPAAMIWMEEKRRARDRHLLARRCAARVRGPGEGRQRPRSHRSVAADGLET